MKALNGLLALALIAGLTACQGKSNSSNDGAPATDRASRLHKKIISAPAVDSETLSRMATVLKSVKMEAVDMAFVFYDNATANDELKSVAEKLRVSCKINRGTPTRQEENIVTDTKSIYGDSCPIMFQETWVSIDEIHKDEQSKIQNGTEKAITSSEADVKTADLQKFFGFTKTTRTLETTMAFFDAPTMSPNYDDWTPETGRFEFDSNLRQTFTLLDGRTMVAQMTMAETRVRGRKVSASELVITVGSDVVRFGTFIENGKVTLYLNGKAVSAKEIEEQFGLKPE